MIYPKQMCNPQTNYTTYCLDYGKEFCPGSCAYAIDKWKKEIQLLNISEEEKKSLNAIIGGFEEFGKTGKMDEEDAENIKEHIDEMKSGLIRLQKESKLVRKKVD